VNDIFISYSGTDRPFVDRLVRDLESERLNVFFDERIAAGEEWFATLKKAIEEARCVLVVLSPDALSSKWFRAETLLAFRREVEGKATVIPLMARECEPPLFLRTKIFADFRDYDAGFKSLLRALRWAKSSVPLNADVPGGNAAQPDPLAEEQLKIELAAVANRFGPPKEIRKNRPRASSNQGRQCFIVMPFGDEALQIVYEDFVRPVIETRCGLECERGDDVFGSSVIMDDIRRSIEAADLVVADLTGKNPNVFYEVGICHTLDKPVLLMAQSLDDVPFDLRHRRVLLYEYSPRGCKRLEQVLEQSLKSMLEKLDQKD